jgi:Protein of unknown function (DUF1552)
MKLKSKTAVTRRRVLRGMLNGAAVTVSLPILDCLLNDSGTAYASGAPLPTRFGAWFWGLGINPTRWIPKKTGADFDMGAELKVIEPYKKYISVLSGFDVLLDGQPNFPHISGWIGVRSGAAPTIEALPSPSFDVLIADAIGSGTRFRSLDMSANGDSRNTLSGRGNGNMNPSVGSALALYERIFGPEFQDPNSGEFKPDPRIMARRSVLSAVSEQRRQLEKRVGAADRARLDQYFTALRQTEGQLGMLLEKPAPNLACVVPPKVGALETGNQIEHVIENHRLMSDLLAMALACNQTRVFNMNFNNPASSLTKVGSTIAHHQMTHEEAFDEKLGYQPGATWFVERCMEAWVTFVGALAKIKEGDGTLLDNTLVLAHTETQFAKYHTIDGIPMMIAGTAGGRVRTGIHVAGKGEPVSSVGLTAMQVMGVSIDRWGTGRMETSKPVSELLA